jgi:hypothetical protein
MVSEPDAALATEVGRFTDYEGMLAAVRARVRELEVSGEALDDYAGLPAGYLSKLIGAQPTRRIGMTSMGPLFDALGIYCVVLKDLDATARLKSRLRPRNGSFVRATYTLRAVTDRQWRRIQKLGRAARWQKLNKQQRSEIMRQVASRRWK